MITWPPEWLCHAVRAAGSKVRRTVLTPDVCCGVTLPVKYAGFGAAGVVCWPWLHAADAAPVVISAASTISRIMGNSLLRGPRVLLRLSLDRLHRTRDVPCGRAFFPPVVGQRPLFSAVGVHHEQLAVR